LYPGDLPVNLYLSLSDSEICFEDRHLAMQYDYADNGTRGEVLAQVRRVVVKIGTRLLMDVKGQGPAERIQQLMKVVGKLRQSGLEVVVVTSGAIGAGMELLKLRRRPKNMAALQALAAVGQCQLMTLYEEASSELGFHCGQLLLTAADLHDRSRHLRVAQCLNELLAREVLPVINENDSVCVDEIKVGDNDTLAALVAGMARADLTILLTTIDGMRERDETTGELGQRMSVVHELGSEIYNMAQGTTAIASQSAVWSPNCAQPPWSPAVANRLSSRRDSILPSCRALWPLKTSAQSSCRLGIGVCTPDSVSWPFFPSRKVS